MTLPPQIRNDLQRELPEPDRENSGPVAANAGQIDAVSFSALFIQRPIATFLLSLAIILAGAVAYNALPVAALPAVEFPVISVGASLPGADPETMASAVATPLERQFTRIAGINQMTSTSSSGSASITLQFELDRDINGAARDVQAAISAARAQLPSSLPSNPTYRKINPADTPIMILAMTSENLSIPQIYDAADSIVAQKLATVQGVGRTVVGGSAKSAIRVEANPQQLASYSLSLSSVAAALQTFNVNEPKGYLNGDSQRWSISATDQLLTAEAYRPLVIATSRGPVSNTQANNGLQLNIADATGGIFNSKSSSGSSSSPSAITTAQLDNGAGYRSAQSNLSASNTVITSKSDAGIVRLQDVAQVTNSLEDIHDYAIFNGRPAVMIIIYKSPGANVIETVDGIQKQLPMLQATIPPSIKLEVTLDRTVTIRASVRDITRTMLITIVLVILVVFLFLRELRSTLIPAVSVPLSLLGTFGVMYLLGYTLDNLSLMALTISTGFVVDDAIVVIENISRHLEGGLSPHEAALLGSKEVGFTVLSMSLSLIAVFIPVLLMGGIVGRLLREFAVTLSVAILISLVVSLSTTPMLSAKFLQPHRTIPHSRFYRWSDKILDCLHTEYESGLSWVLNHQLVTLVVTIGTFLLNVYLFVLVPKGFFPQQDTGQISGTIIGQQDISFDAMKWKVQQMADIVMSDPAVLNVMSAAGAGAGANNGGHMYIFLKPEGERKGVSADGIIARLRPQVSTMPGATTYLQSPQDLNIGGRTSSTQYQYTLSTDVVSNLNTWAPRMLIAMQQQPELRDVATDQQNDGLRAQLVIDRDTASRLGLRALDIDQALSMAFSQRQVSTIYKPLNQYHVVLEVAPEWQRSPDILKNLYVKASTGAEIPLAAVTQLRTERVPLQVNHQGLSPSTTLSFNVGPGISLSQATNAVERARNAIGLPSSISGNFQGTAAAFKSSLSSEPVLILLALMAVYIVLGILYESLIHPFTILSTLPSAGVGALVTLLIMKIELSVIAMIGILLLVGIVKKNAIMMIDFALVAERDHGKTPTDAIREACLLRFRPIMMTTSAALLGAVPLALGHGTGSELRRPLGFTIIGGLIVSQALTLFSTPVVYLYMDRLQRFAGRVVAISPAPESLHSRELHTSGR